MNNFLGLALAGAAKIKLVGDQARRAFVDRDDLVEAIEWAFASGEHLIVLGPPGTSKSSVVRFFADGLGLPFFRKLLNPDTTRDEVVGPLDPNQLDKGIWDRAWSGLATHPVVFLDEAGKASSQVKNMQLDAMEERKVSTPSLDRDIPLHTLVSASNETFGDDDAAAWDRYTIRVRVGRLNASSKIVGMWTRNRGKRQPGDERPTATSVGLTEEEMRALRLVAAWMAENASDQVCEMGAQLWSQIGSVQQKRVSDRRWERIMVVAAGKALLEGRTEILPEDLIVARHMLWETIDKVEPIDAFVRGLVDAELTEIRARSRMVQELEEMAERATDDEAKARVLFRAQRQKKDIDAKGERSDWVALGARVKAVMEKVC